MVCRSEEKPVRIVLELSSRATLLVAFLRKKGASFDNKPRCSKFVNELSIYNPFLRWLGSVFSQLSVFSNLTLLPRIIQAKSILTT